MKKKELTLDDEILNHSKKIFDLTHSSDIVHYSAQSFKSGYFLCEENMKKKKNPIKIFNQSIIIRIPLILIGAIFGWYAGQLIAFGFLFVFKEIGFEDNIYRFFNAITLFK